MYGFPTGYKACGTVSTIGIAFDLLACSDECCNEDCVIFDFNSNTKVCRTMSQVSGFGVEADTTIYSNQHPDSLNPGGC
jgi:hypothetical protein